MEREQIVAGQTRGELRVYRKGMKRVAVLLGPDGERYLLPLLDKVKLLAMDERGVLLTGTEIVPPRGAKGNGDLYPQTWWCLLGKAAVRTDECTPAESRMRERDRLARSIGATMANSHSRRGKYQP